MKTILAALSMFALLAAGMLTAAPTQARTAHPTPVTYVQAHKGVPASAGLYNTGSSPPKPYGAGP